MRRIGGRAKAQSSANGEAIRARVTLRAARAVRTFQACTPTSARRKPALRRKGHLMTLSSHALHLTRFARSQLRFTLGGPEPLWPSGNWCDVPRATFVTLRWSNGVLQGCTGNIRARRPLIVDVAENIVGAALRDPRALPVTLDDADALDIEVSVLSDLETIDFTDEDSAIAALRPNVDGVVLQWRARHATLFPVTWNTYADARAFMHELKRKACVPRSFWARDVRLWRFTVETFVDVAPATVAQHERARAS